MCIVVVITGDYGEYLELLAVTSALFQKVVLGFVILPPSVFFMGNFSESWSIYMLCVISL